MRLAKKIALMVLAVLLVGHGQARAATPLGVGVSVVSNCTITAGSMSFGSYDPLASTPIVTTSTIAVACTKGTTGATIGLDNGQHHANATGGQQRAMISGATNFLSYDIWQNSSHSTFWGNTAGTNTEAVPTPTSKVAQSFTAYGQIPTHQNVRLGSYADTVVATVNF